VKKLEKTKPYWELPPVARCVEWHPTVAVLRGRKRRPPVKCVDRYALCDDRMVGLLPSSVEW
jgi:hypothetical protein